MSRSSLRLRLLAAAALSVVLALAVAGAGLTYLFERHVERRVEAELAAYLKQLVGGVAVAADGRITLAEPTDPRFGAPFSGHYWQVEAAGAGGQVIRSRSLWDSALTLPPDTLPDGQSHFHEIAGPAHSLLLAVERSVTVTRPGGESPIRAVVALDHREVTVAAREFAYDLIPSLALLAAVLIAAAWIQVTIGLAPLERLRRAVATVVSGQSQRLAAGGPQEVEPLVDEINRLLAAQELALAKAKARAADLAHGLKTPLQVLAADIRTLRDKGEVRIADEIDSVAGTIARHVERELARARIGGTAGASMTRIADVARRVVAVLERTPRGSDLTFVVEVPDTFAYPIDEADLAEILGNLGENACRFAKARITIASKPAAGGLSLSVTDDGTGIPEPQRQAALARGGRLDSRSEGNGLGLAIVADTAEAYGGRLRLEDAAPGLRAIVELPARRTAGLSGAAESPG